MRDLRLRLSALCLAVLTSGAITNSASAQPVPAAERSAPLAVPAFLAELDRLITTVPRAQTSELLALRETIPAKWIVRSGDGEVQVPAAWLRRSLEEGRRDPPSWPARRGDIAARLAATRAEAAMLHESSDRADVAGARPTLESVLAEKEFRRSAGAGVMARLRRAITGWFLRLWQLLGGERLGRRSTAVVFAWTAGIAALVTLIWWLVRTLAISRDQGRLALSPPPASRQSAKAWALQAAAARDPREAARCAYRAAVVRLEEEGAWRVDAARTPREHMRLLADGHTRRTLFADVARRFEEIWFGGRTASADDTRALLARLRELGCLPAD